MPVTNAADQYTRFMVEMFDDRDLMTTPTGFQAFFGKPGASLTVFNPDRTQIEIDIIRGNEKLAALIPRGVIGRSIGSRQKDLQAERYTSLGRVFPLIQEDGNITAGDLLKRQPGEDPYNVNVTRLDRLRLKALRVHMESCRRIIRTFEYLASLSILTGKMPSETGIIPVSQYYDFYRRPEHIISVPVAWNETNAVIMQNIDEACELVDQDGHLAPDFMGIGVDAMDAFIKDGEIQKLADNRRFELIEVSLNNPVPPKFNRFLKGGWIPRGRFRTAKGYELWVFNYHAYYDDDLGVKIKFMPQDQAFICNSEARCDRYFGPPEVLPDLDIDFYMRYFGFNMNAPLLPPSARGLDDIIMPAMFMPYAYISEDKTNLTHRVQAAPIFVTNHTDAFVTLTDLIV